MPCAAPNKADCFRLRRRAFRLGAAQRGTMGMDVGAESGGTAGADRGGPLPRCDGFAADRRHPPARSSHGGVPDAAHAAQSHEEPAADLFGGGHQPVAGRRQVAFGGESGAGRVAPGRQQHAAVRFRFPPSADAHHVRAGPQPGNHGLSAGEGSAAQMHPQAGRDLVVRDAGRAKR